MIGRHARCLNLGTSWLAVLLVWPLLSQAQTTLDLAIFAYRPKPIMTKQFGPLAAYLDAAVPEAHVVLKVLSQTEIEGALARGEIDLVFTNPGHFVLLRRLNQLTGAMATQITLEQGQRVNQLGGVILTTAEHREINNIKDLVNKRIAVPGKKYLGGYQAQAYELMEAGVDPNLDVELYVVGSHDGVIQSLLAGEAEAGFVRTGIVEAMIREGKLPVNRLKVIQPQEHANFPFRVSTRLYPEWAFAALPHVDEHISAKIAAALLNLDPDMPAAKTADLHGFSVPADYTPVEELARALRLPPFEAAPAFTPRDIWTRFQPAIVIGLTTGLLILLLAIWLYLSNQRLKQAQNALRKNEAGLRALLDNTPYLMWLKDRESRFVAVNRAFMESIKQRDAGDIIGKTDYELWSTDLAERYRAEDQKVMASTQQQWIEARETHLGKPCWMETYKTPIVDEQGVLLGTAGFSRDVSERHEREERRLAEEMAHRETLVREVHHRIKNNLQSVAGLLRRELGKYTELDPRLETAITQVHAIATVHGLQSDSPGETTRLCETIDQICKTLREQTQRPLTWLPGDQKQRNGKILIDHDEAVAVALILNELVLNALKHSPPDAPEPEVSVTALGEGLLIAIRNVMKSSPGVMKPSPGVMKASPGFDFERGSGVNTGLRLVRSLLPENGATLRFEHDPAGWLTARLELGNPVVRQEETP